MWTSFLRCFTVFCKLAKRKLSEFRTFCQPFIYINWCGNFDWKASCVYQSYQFLRNFRNAFLVYHLIRLQHGHNYASIFVGSCKHLEYLKQSDVLSRWNRYRSDLMRTYPNWWDITKTNRYDKMMCIQSIVVINNSSSTDRQRSLLHLGTHIFNWMINVLCNYNELCHECWLECNLPS